MIFIIQLYLVINFKYYSTLLLLSLWYLSEYGPCTNVRSTDVGRYKVRTVQTSITNVSDGTISYVRTSSQNTAHNEDKL